MRLYRATGASFTATPCAHSPRLSSAGGRNWDFVDVLLADQPTRFWWDRERGAAYYFRWRDQWQRAPFDRPHTFPRQPNVGAPLANGEVLTIAAPTAVTHAQRHTTMQEQ